LPAQILNACEATSTSRPRIRFLQCSLKGLLNECMVAPLPYEALPVTLQVLLQSLAMASTRSATRSSSAALSPDAQPSNYASTAQGPLCLAQSPSYSSVMSGLGSPPTRTSTSLSAQPGRQDLPAPGRIGALANCSGSNVLCCPPPLNPRSCPASGSSLAFSPSNHSGPSNSTGSQPGTPRAL